MPTTQDAIKITNSLVETIAGQMEIAAEFSHGYFCAANNSIFRYHELASDPECENLIQLGLLQFIPSITSQDLYLWMIEFSVTIHDPFLRKQLETSLKGISATWKFKNVLYHNCELQEQWDRFKINKLQNLALDWLESL